MGGNLRRRFCIVHSRGTSICTLSSPSRSREDKNALRRNSGIVDFCHQPNNSLDFGIEILDNSYLIHNKGASVFPFKVETLSKELTEIHPSIEHRSCLREERKCHAELVYPWPLRQVNRWISVSKFLLTNIQYPYQMSSLVLLAELPKLGPSKPMGNGYECRLIWLTSLVRHQAGLYAGKSFSPQ